jgi:hypothetical protein
LTLTYPLTLPLTLKLQEGHRQVYMMQPWNLSFLPDLPIEIKFCLLENAGVLMQERS